MTKCIRFDKKTPKDEDIILDGEVLEFIGEMKNLEVILDISLNFKPHIDTITAKLSRVCDF